MNTEAYKKSHRPQMTNEEKSGKPHQAIYLPKHPDKVVGGEIITRSGWEMSFARWCDDNPSVIEWGSEPCCIQYRNPAGVDLDACRKYNASPLDPANWPICNYYPDFYIVLRSDEDVDGTDVKKLLIEIKPLHQTQRPVPPPVGAKLQEQKRFNDAARTYMQNVKKWEAAIEWCKNHDMEFVVYTEVTLEKLGII